MYLKTASDETVRVHTHLKKCPEAALRVHNSWVCVNDIHKHLLRNTLSSAPDNSNRTLLRGRGCCLLASGTYTKRIT